MMSKSLLKTTLCLWTSCVEQSSWWTEITWHHSDYVQKQTEDVII